VADVLIAGERTVDLGVATDQLLERGLPRMLSEGGPHLLADLYATDLVDELCLAISPLVACGEGSRITAGPSLPSLHPQRLETVLERDGFLFLRYVRPSSAEGPTL
ncbi:MAG TPA: dihydrofolate reductase family protein, partial [Intrasporangium sp.]|uniref:dihydrofolate reductase family protein n=1 Tax=Intrasporangium sp. TaxID=1925024 RepID=UPI002D7A0DA9